MKSISAKYSKSGAVKSALLFAVCSLLLIAFVSYFHMKRLYVADYKITPLIIVLLLAFMGAVRRIFDKRIQLKIDETGIFYRYRTKETVSWSEIKSINYINDNSISVVLRDSEETDPRLSQYIKKKDFVIRTYFLDCFSEDVAEVIDFYKEKFITPSQLSRLVRPE